MKDAVRLTEIFNINNQCKCEMSDILVNSTLSIMGGELNLNRFPLYQYCTHDLGMKNVYEDTAKKVVFKWIFGYLSLLIYQISMRAIVSVTR